MRTRRTFTDDSLDMLLDTITNLFGGIVFIAILIALMTGEQADRTFASVDAELAKAVNLQTDLDQAGVRVTRKTALAAYLEGLVGQPDESWDETLRKLDRDIAAAEKRLKESERKLEHVEIKRAPIEDKLELAKERADDIRTTVHELEAEIQAELKLRKLEARLPVAKKTPKRPAHIILTRGRLFVLDGCNGGLIPILDNENRDVEYVDHGGNQTEIVLRRSGGLPVDRSMARTTRWRRLCDVVSSRVYFLYIMVYPDAYEDFLQFRQAAVAAGYDYDVSPVPAGENVMLVPGSGFTTQ